jgi:hypothetical protein
MQSISVVAVYTVCMLMVLSCWPVYTGTCNKIYRYIYVALDNFPKDLLLDAFESFVLQSTRFA